MSTTNHIDGDSETNLDDFSAEFFGQNNADPEETNSESQTEVEEEGSDAPTDDTQPDEDDDTLAPDDDEDDSDTDSEAEDSDDSNEEEDEKPAEPKKKSRFQERIDELTAKHRETERQLEATLAKLEELGKNKEPEPTPVKEADPVATTSKAPSPNDVNEDGTDKYPLGEFDPKYINDVMDHRWAVKEAEIEAKAQQKAQAAEQQAQFNELQQNWNTKLEDAQERYPDFQEKGQQLVDTFSGIDKQYGDYLTTTLMSMDHGPDVLYYLANNPDEAQNIVAQGAAKATIAFGRLEAQFASNASSSEPKVVKPTKAPPPPPVNKGSSRARTSVEPDTDDLDAFEKSFFKGK